MPPSIEIISRGSFSFQTSISNREIFSGVVSNARRTNYMDRHQIYRKKNVTRLWHTQLLFKGERPKSLLFGLRTVFLSQNHVLSLSLFPVWLPLIYFPQWHSSPSLDAIRWNFAWLIINSHFSTCWSHSRYWIPILWNFSSTNFKSFSFFLKSTTIAFEDFIVCILNIGKKAVVTTNVQNVGKKVVVTIDVHFLVWFLLVSSAVASRWLTKYLKERTEKRTTTSISTLIELGIITVT